MLLVFEFAFILEIFIVNAVLLADRNGRGRITQSPRVFVYGRCKSVWLHVNSYSVMNFHALTAYTKYIKTVTVFGLFTWLHQKYILYSVPTCFVQEGSTPWRQLPHAASPSVCWIQSFWITAIFQIKVVIKHFIAICCTIKIIFSNHYNLEEALQICEEREYTDETVFLLGRVCFNLPAIPGYSVFSVTARMGNASRALSVIIDHYPNVFKAVEFCKEQNDMALWIELIDRSINRPGKNLLNCCICY